MSRDQATLEKEVIDVQVARWEGFQRLAKALPDHHVLALEMYRTLNDQTVAVYTVVLNNEPVRFALRGDSRGRLLQTREQSAVDPGCDQPMAAAMTASDMREAVDDTGIDPNLTTYGRPPPQIPVPPGFTDSGAAALLNTFGAGADGSSK